MGVFFVKKSGKWEVFFVKKWKMGFFCNKVDLSSTQGALCTVSVFFFILHFTYLGVRTHPTHPTAYGPGGDIPSSSPDRWSVSASALKF